MEIKVGAHKKLSKAQLSLLSEALNQKELPPTFHLNVKANTVKACVASEILPGYQARLWRLRDENKPKEYPGLKTFVSTQSKLDGDELLGFRFHSNDFLYVLLADKTTQELVAIHRIVDPEGRREQNKVVTVQLVVSP